jgi:hypothetical protein
MCWEELPTLVDPNRYEPCVVFKDMGEYILRGFGHCVISGPLEKRGNSNVFGKLWYTSAKCTCIEFLESGFLPCVHILFIYLLLCQVQDQSEMAKLQCGRAAMETLREKQRSREFKKTDSYRYPNMTGSSGEFVHHMVVQEAFLNTADANIIPGEISPKKLLQEALKQADWCMRKFLSRTGFAITEISCHYTTTLLQSMRDPRFRELCRRIHAGTSSKGVYSETWYDKPLPSYTTTKTYDQAYKKYVLTSIFEHVDDKPLSEVQKRSKRAYKDGASDAINNVFDSFGRRFNQPKIPRY